MIELVSFVAGKNHQGWRSSCTVAELAAPPAPSRLTNIAGDELSGIGIALPLEALPVDRIPIHPEGRNAVHAGTFLLQNQFAEPVDIQGCDSIMFHFHSTSAVPITLYLDLEGSVGIRSDLYLHTGEQIVRMDLKAHRRSRLWHLAKGWTGRVAGIKIDFWPQDAFYPHPPARNAKAVLLGVAACRQVPAVDQLPYRGKAIWLTQYRANIPHVFSASIKESRLRRSPKGKQYLDYNVGYIGERFRTMTEDRALTPLLGITAGEAPSAELRRAAQYVQQYLEKICGVRLPVTDRPVDPDTRNLIIPGWAAAENAKGVTPLEWKHAGREGFIIRAHRGRIIIAGGSDRSTLYGVSRYLQDHGVRFYQPGVREVVPKVNFLHELYLLDWPYFADRSIADRWQLMCQAPAGKKKKAPPTMDVATLASRIKDCARRKMPATPEIIAAAALSPLHQYVCAKLLWNPFLDASRLIQEFETQPAP